MSTAALAVALVALPVALGATLFARAGFQLTSCIETPGATGWLGTRLALVHADPSCDPGAMMPGGAPAQVLTVLACVTLPVLLAHLCGGLAAIGLVQRSVRAVARVRGAIVRRPHQMPRPVAIPAPRRVALPVEPVLSPLTPRPVLAVLALRGPPMLAAAA
ncbi:MAG: hypothetical protein LBK59_11990 [Bifidobacteriaceae bacterium]|nr:hypothetical protein [Bifidobacteriaceae bacterium]